MQPNRTATRPSVPPVPRLSGRRPLSALLAQRSVQLTIAAWVAAHLAVLALAHGHLPFHRPSLHHAPFGTQLLSPNLAMLEALGIIALVFALTRRRVIPDVGVHLVGTLYGTDDVVRPGEVAVWAGYNFLVFAVAPYLYFRRRYTAVLPPRPTALLGPLRDAAG